VRIFGSTAKLFAQKRPAGRNIFWHLACNLPSRRISFSLPCAGALHEEAWLKMRKLREIMAALVIATLVSAGAFAQGRGRGQDKLPDKKPVKVKDGKGSGGGRPSNPPDKPPKQDRGGKKKP